MKHLSLLLLVLLMSLSPAFAEVIRVTGTVTDETNQPLVGVTVVEKTTSKGTVTDANGQFSIDATPGATLVFSFIGYVAKSVVVGNQSVINVQLANDAIQLNEVVAVGYQTVRKSDVTGAIANVRAKELNIAAPTLGQALVGKLAGVQVSQVSGAPYVGTKIRVRGVGSINASSEPLYVIDGYPVDGFPSGRNDIFINPNDIESIDILKDAASAAIYGSRASGGVVLITTKRGRDGKGKFEYEYQYGINQLAKKVKLLNSEQFVQLLIDARNSTYRDLMQNAGRPFTAANFSDPNATRVANVGNASAVQIPTQFYDFATQQLIKPQYDTDWQDELYRNAPMARHNFQFSGGNNNLRYLLSAGYQNQQGIIVATKQERINFRANVDGDITRKFKIGASIFVTSTQNREVQEGRFNQGSILGALIYPPIFRAYDNGNLIKNEAASQQPTFGYQTVENPVALAMETNITRRGLRGSYNGTATYEIIPGLVAKANLGMQTYNEKYEYYLPTSLSAGNQPPGSPAAIAAARATANTLSNINLLGEFTATYTKQFGRHGLDALLGYSAQRYNQDQISVTASGFQNDRVQEVTAKGADAANFFLNSGSTGKIEETLLSYFSRVAYNFDNKYFLTGSLRRDGSSRFGPLNRYGTFPSLSAGWTISNEPFYNDLLGAGSSLKLRASWGLVGNYNIGNYNFLQTMASPGGAVFGPGTVQTAFWAGAIKDQALGWESTSQYNLGLDAGLLNNRLGMNINTYLSYSYDLLFNQPISAISGASTILTNLRDSKIENRGVELQLDGKIIATPDYSLNLSGNISFNRNKVLDMGGANTVFGIGAERQYITHVTQEGSPVGMFYGFKVIGMVREKDMEGLAQDNAAYNAATQSFPAGYVLKGPARSVGASNPLRPGDLIFEDVDKNGVVNDADKRIIGTPYPKFTYGFALNTAFKGLDLNMSFNGSQGNEVLDGQDYYVYNMEASGNQYADVVNRYRSETEPGNGLVYRAARGGTQSNNTRLSTFYLQNGSYFRCTNITVGYNIPATLLNRVKLSGVRVYGNVNNAFTVTKYKGYNPEVDYTAGQNLTPGVDYGMYPLARGYNVGMKLTF